MTQREQLYYMIEAFYRNEYDVDTFCDVYHDVFYPDIPFEDLFNELSELEAHHFESLWKTTSRFSPYEEDHALCSRAFANETDVINAIQLVRTALISKTEESPESDNL